MQNVYFAYLANALTMRIMLKFIKYTNSDFVLVNCFKIKFKKQQQRSFIDTSAGVMKHPNVAKTYCRQLKGISPLRVELSSVPNFSIFLSRNKVLDKKFQLLEMHKI